MKYWLLLLAVGLSACGGGGSAADNGPPPQRSDLLFTFFGSVDNPAHMELPAAPGQPSSVQETAPFINLVMTGGWGDWSTATGRQNLMDIARKHLLQAKAGGVEKAVVVVDFLTFWNKAYVGAAQMQPQLLALLAGFRADGTLPMVVALYPSDEPNLNVALVSDVVQANADMHAVLAESPDTAGIQLMTIYGTAHLGLGGIESFDWVGVDNYDQGADVLTEDVATVRAMLTDAQRLVIVPGGVEPWFQDPTPFVSYANKDSKVVAIVAFVWFTHGTQPGIRDNQMRAVYVQAGCAVAQRVCA